MRQAFIKTLVQLAAKDDRIFLLTGDLGYMALEPFAQSFPDRFINAGVAEQNMVGVATGLAEAGFIPFVYSIVTFATLRPYEFIRNGPVLHKLPVRIVGVGGGMEYAHNGASHYGLEDLAVMRAQPGLRVISPADHVQTVTALEKTWNLDGPTYYRLGKDDRISVPELNGRFNLGRTERIMNGADLLIVTAGAITSEAMRAAELLQDQGLNPAITVVSSFNPAPIDDLLEELSRFSCVITLESHYAAGGLGSLISEVIATNGLSCRQVRLAVEEQPDGITGDQKYLFNKYGISAEHVAAAAKTLLAGVAV